MSELYQDNRPVSAFGSFKAMLNRWVFGGQSRPVSAAGTAPNLQGRRPGAGRPVYIEVSPAAADPFPEPQTMPGGWDLSELMKPRNK